MSNESQTPLPERLGRGLQRANVLGCELRYARGGHRPTVVLLHTLRTQLEYFVPLVRALEPGFEIVIPDLPGHGRSTAPAVAYTATYFTDAMTGFLEACDLRDVLLVGESIGASIALALAARRNPRLARVVAINPYDYGRGGGIRRSSPLANVLFTAMLELPVTLAYGEHDWSWPEDREANRRALPAARHLSLEGCGHFSCLERPERIAHIIREEAALMGEA
jgi:pimeloyl-ACP methyl ester carboxylesterase